ncbi:hypothetical protein [Haloparvum sp. PAK95]|uniref:hypothetical protein n=1 Tax=Haloparvum sp. PAK95 TaxID=3418962 RepID=UPI003D2F107B
MGISVSASTAIILAGAFIAFGALTPVVSNGFDRVSSAGDAVHDRALDRQNTGVDLANATYSDGTLTVEANNTGSTSLSVPETVLLADNEFVPLASNDTAVDGNGATELWLPGETVRITVDVDQPNRVTLTTEYGVTVSDDVVVV